MWHGHVVALYGNGMGMLAMAWACWERHGHVGKGMFAEAMAMGCCGAFVLATVPNAVVTSDEYDNGDADDMHGGM